MTDFRFECRALIDPDHSERDIEGSPRRHVSIVLCDGPGVLDELGRPVAPRPVACTLRPAEARELGFELLCLAEHAEGQRPEPGR